MAREETVFVAVDDEGEVHIKVEGVPGPGCLELTKDLEEALGDVKNRQRTAEYNEKPQQSKQRQARKADH